MHQIVNLIKKVVRLPGRTLRWICRYLHIRKETSRLLRMSADDAPKIFYFGITEHSNMGDLAQYYCIGEWIRTNYPSRSVYEFEATTIVDERFDFLEKFGRVFNGDDIIVFQSGYTTTDLGGYHDLMHRLVIDRFPQANILMMPQTIFFTSEANRQITSTSYNKAGNMLFLARDKVSYDQAVQMFPDVKSLLYPDIVTSLIGKLNFEQERNGIFMCCRNDSEKFYSNDELNSLKKRLMHFGDVSIGDTNDKTHYTKIRENIEEFVLGHIETFASYRLVITDRYHGTIFSLAANTPVIVIQTNDHKVTTGVDWFKGVYDDSVFLAHSLDHAFELAEKILATYDYPILQSHFKEEYYDKLKSSFESLLGDRSEMK